MQIAGDKATTRHALQTPDKSAYLVHRRRWLRLYKRVPPEKRMPTYPPIFQGPGWLVPPLDVMAVTLCGSSSSTKRSVGPAWTVMGNKHRLPAFGFSMRQPWQVRRQTGGGKRAQESGLPIRPAKVASRAS